MLSCTYWEWINSTLHTNVRIFSVKEYFRVTNSGFIISFIHHTSHKAQWHINHRKVRVPSQNLYLYNFAWPQYWSPNYLSFNFEQNGNSSSRVDTGIGCYTCLCMFPLALRLQLLSVELELELSVLITSTSSPAPTVPPAPPPLSRPVSMSTCPPPISCMPSSPWGFHPKCPCWPPPPWWWLECEDGGRPGDCEWADMEPLARPGDGIGGGAGKAAGAVTRWANCWASGRSARARKPPRISMSVG
jgi:hypothetical protein